MFVSNTPAWEMEKSKLDITGILIINTMVLVLFCTFIAPTRWDNVKSKPLIGFFGLFSATLATVRYFFWFVKLENHKSQNDFFWFKCLYWNFNTGSRIWILLLYATIVSCESILMDPVVYPLNKRSIWAIICGSHSVSTVNVSFE